MPLCNRSGRAALGDPHFRRLQLASFCAAHRIREFLRLRVPRSLHAVGIVDRLNLLRQITFSPEQAGGARMKQLAGVYSAAGALAW